MRFLCIFVLTLVSIAGVARADEPKPLQPGPWKFGGVLGVNVAQSSFSDNWRGGDKGSLAWVAFTDMSAERQFSLRFNLTNKLQAAFGQTAQQSSDPADPRRKRWDRPQKSTDLLALESVGRFTLGGAVDPFIAFRGETQFVDESSPIGKIPFNPIILKEMVGVARLLEKTETSEAITRVGFALRQTIAKSFTDPVTKDKERFMANDGGLDWQTYVTRPILNKRVLYKGSLDVYKPLFYSKSDNLKEFDVRADSAAAAIGTTHGPVSDYWKTVEVNFLNTFSAQITKVLSVNLLIQWVYDKYDAAANTDPDQPFDVLQAEIDKNVRKSGQFKETLGLGLSYRLF
jgi:Protein of unknown function (DUF3078)